MSKSAVLVDIKFDIAGKMAAFRKALPGREIINWAQEKRQPEALGQVKYAIVWQPQPGLMKRLPKLEVIFSLGAGVDHIFDDPELPDVPIVRFVDPDLTGRMVEYITLQVLMHTRQQRGYDGLQHGKKWLELEHPAAHQFRVGFIGFGELGQASAKVLLALGFQINCWSRSAKNMTGVKSYHGKNGFDEFLKHTDIAICLLPHTPETRGILNTELFAKLAKDGPFGAPVLINAGRGGSQKENDIVDALNQGILHGVSLDVFETEPLAKASSLWGFPNAILTPHVAAVSDELSLALHVNTQIERYEFGRKLQFVVDPKRGY